MYWTSPLKGNGAQGQKKLEWLGYQMVLSFKIGLVVLMQFQ